MKKNKLLVFGFLIILTISFPNNIFAREPIDEYKGNISWNEEKSRLAKFVVHLRNEPNTKGCIIFQLGTKETQKKINSRISRMKKLLFSNYSVDEKLVDFVTSDTPSPYPETYIILYLTLENSCRPDF